MALLFCPIIVPFLFHAHAYVQGMFEEVDVHGRSLKIPAILPRLAGRYTLPTRARCTRTCVTFLCLP